HIMSASKLPEITTVIMCYYLIKIAFHIQIWLRSSTQQPEKNAKLEEKSLALEFDMKIRVKKTLHHLSR
ncbi:hypothetical protein ACTGZP_11575, partial [Streptococcus suis]